MFKGRVFADTTPSSKAQFPIFVSGHSLFANKTMTTALTFFSGAGGMCAGLAQAEFKIIGGNEWDPFIADIWDANHPGVKCDRRSILDIPIEDLSYADLYHFSPPCQMYSQSNPNRTTGTDDEDTEIAQRIAAIIIHGRIP
jgi:site-specific DNA-cytosine methylase